jgi:hypothetical protein
MGFNVNLPAKAILVTSPPLLMTVNVQLELRRAAIGLHIKVTYLIHALLIRWLADRNRVEFQFVEINFLGLDRIEIDHKVCIILPHQKELPIDKITDLHLLHKPEIDAKDIPQGNIGLYPVNLLIILISKLNLTVPEYSPDEEQHDDLDDGILIEVALHLIPLARVTQDVDELHHQLLHLVAGELHVVVGQARHRCEVALVRVELLFEPL